MSVLTQIIKYWRDILNIKKKPRLLVASPSDNKGYMMDMDVSFGKGSDLLR